MGTFSENAAALGREMPDDVLVLKRRVAELEDKLVRAGREISVYRLNYHEWVEKRGRAFTLAEEILIELKLQRHADTSTIVAAALADIRKLVDDATVADMVRDAAGGAPRRPSYYVTTADDDPTTFHSLENDLPDYDEEGGRVIELSPVWHGRSRFAVVEFIDVDRTTKVHIFTDEDEAIAAAVAVQARQEAAQKEEETDAIED